jgi:hypothetical protein
MGMADDIADLTAISVGDCSVTEHFAHPGGLSSFAEPGR